jgi:hypothetical protein
MRTSIAVSLLLSVALSGCTTIYFDKGKNVKATEVTEKWHHNFALGLYEQSPPVNPKRECGSKAWVSVKTEESFLNGLAGGAVNLFGPIWYPQTVEIACK